jgi:hypothetical protein
MKTGRRIILLFVIVSSFILHPSSFLRADGGTVRVAEQKGNYRITVFTTPTPFRRGPVDISVFVQDAATGEPVPEVQVDIRAARRGSPEIEIEQEATKEAATNKLFYAANFDVPEAGWYAVEVSIDGPLGEARVSFEVEAAERNIPDLTMWAWVGWPVLAIMLFSIHQFLVRRRSGRAAPGRSVDPPGKLAASGTSSVTISRWAERR